MIKITRLNNHNLRIINVPYNCQKFYLTELF